MGTGRFKLHGDSVICAGTQLEYRFYLSRKRRTLGMSVHPDGSVIVRSPAGVPLKTIRDFVIQQSGWIVKTRLRIESRTPAGSPALAADNGFPYQGNSYTLQIVRGEREMVEIRFDELVVTTSAEPGDSDRIQLLIDGWYRRQALKLFGERLVVCHDQLRGENIPLPRGLVIRAMRSRWGSYSYRTRRICLNLQLIKAPLECLDYVVIHELCHAVVRHHGADFWSLVGRFVPDYLRVREHLKAYISISKILP